MPAYLLEMPDTPICVRVSDQGLARHFHQDGILLETAETALLLGSLRRLIRPASRLSPIRLLVYFRPVIEELCELPAPENYREYLRLKPRQAAKASRQMIKNYVC